MTVSHNLVTNVSAWFFCNTVNLVEFSVIHVSQGSVATYVRCGGMFTKRCTANFLLSMSVKEFLKSVKIWQSYCPKFGGFHFGTQCSCLRCHVLMTFEFLAFFSFYCVYVFVCTLSVPLHLLSLLFIWTVLSEINDLI